MSDTPRTDAKEWDAGCWHVRRQSVVDADFARELERELAAEKAQLVSNADELAAMQKQRDEARRLYCVEMSRQSTNPTRFTPEWCANELGWDCFKEGGGA